MLALSGALSATLAAVLTAVVVNQAPGSGVRADGGVASCERGSAEMLRRCVESTVSALVDAGEVRAALRTLAAYDQVPSFAGMCHPTAHLTGRAAFAYFSDVRSALAAGERSCQGGYYHGVMEAAGLGLNKVEFDRQYRWFCVDVSGVSDYGSCVHGIGHGVWYATGQQLPQSVELCDLLPSSRDARACVDGVFMARNSETPPEHGWERFRVCDAFALEIRAACLTNSMLDMDSEELESVGGFEGVKKYCHTLEGLLVTSCYLAMAHASAQHVDTEGDISAQLVSVCQPFDSEIGAQSEATLQCLRRVMSVGASTFGRQVLDEICALDSVAPVASECASFRDEYLTFATSANS